MYKRSARRRDPYSGSERELCESEVGPGTIADDVDIQGCHSSQADVCSRCLVFANVFEKSLHSVRQRTNRIP